MEVIMAAAIFSIALLAIFGIFPLTARSVRQAERRSAALQLAQGELERLRARNLSLVRSQAPLDLPVDYTHHGEPVQEIFSVETIVNPDNPTAPLKTVTLVVRWRVENRDQELRLETQLARREP